MPLFRFNYILKLLFSIFFVCVLHHSAYTQTNALLQQKVTINTSNVSIPTLLSLIEKNSSIRFSYKSDLFNIRKKVSANYVETELAHILKDILGTQYKWVVTNDHVVLLRNDNEAVMVQGLLVDINTLEPIENASVFDLQNLNGVITDEKGKFNLVVNKSSLPLQVSIRHIGYIDTTILIKSHLIKNEPILLTPAYATMDEVAISDFQKHWLNKRILGNNLKINSLNLAKYFNKQPYQFSLLPGLGSKNLRNSQSINSVSFNLLGGYVKGVNGFEIGTIFNIVQQDMQYVQFGGLFNIVGGNIKGVQIAGAYNYGAKNQSGVQFSGLFNYQKGNAEGVMIAGAVNSNMNIIGVQSAGLFNQSRGNVKGAQLVGGLNIAKQVKGWQLAGLMNISQATNSGGQIAGACNMSVESKGVQISGLMNKNDSNSTGIQISGALNYNRKEIRGIQIAGIINIAGKVKGTQIGLINYADSASGPSIGIINIVKYGKKTIAITNNEWQLFQLSYKSGAHHFYNIMQFGMHPAAPNKSMSIGYGIGWQSKHKKDWKWAHELIGHTIYKGNWNDQNILFQFQSLIHKKIFKHLYVHAGPTFNLMFQENNNNYVGFTNSIPYKPTGLKLGNHFNGWLGYSIGFSFN